MLKQFSSVAVVAAALVLAGPASAQVVTITQQKALAGGTTSNDTAGYPITISQSGSYRLDSNLTVPNGVNGIQVQVADVTIDLNGFTIEGNGVGVIGIYGNSIADSVTVKNGTIPRFRQDGIYSTRHYWHVDSMRLTANGRYGIHLGRSAQIRNSIIGENVDSGIYTDFSCVIEGNIINSNRKNGITTLTSTVLGNTISANALWESMGADLPDTETIQ